VLAQSPPSPEAVGIDQRLGSAVTLDAVFRDEHGAPTTLREAAGGKPILLVLVYYRCPMLCNQILNGLQEAVVGMNLRSGEHFRVLAVSFDPRETADLAAGRKARCLKALGSAGHERDWRFLTGTAEATERLCRETGFRVLYDAGTSLYTHASALLVLTPQGRISRYFMGITYRPRDVKLAIEEASEGKVGRLSDRILLLCYQYDPASGRYTLAVWRLLRAAAIATVTVLVLLIGILLWIRRRAARSRDLWFVLHPAEDGAP
jgi:protein SCO1/2